MESELLIKFIRFCLVGTLGLVVDFGTTFFLKEKLKVTKYIANSIGFTLAVLNNFYLNKYWTFLDTNPSIIHQLTSFILISIAGLLMSNLIIYMLSLRKINFYLAKVIAILVVVLWNFIMNYQYSFGS